MTTTMNRSRNSLREVVKKTAPLTLFVNAISVAISYGLYEAAFHLSMLPFWIAAGMSIFAIVGPNVVVLLDKNNSRLVALGVANGFMIMAFYFFCGVVPFFFYFMFAPMPAYMHASGLALGIAMTCYWMAFVARDVNRALVTSNFVRDAFEDAGSVLLYRLKNVALLEAVLNARSPSGKLHMYMVLLTAPLALVIGRVMAPVFGPYGPILLSALILFPVSQWIAGIGIRQYIVMIRLPRKLEHTTGKPVVVISDGAKVM